MLDWQPCWHINERCSGWLGYAPVVKFLFCRLFVLIMLIQRETHRTRRLHSFLHVLFSQHKLMPQSQSAAQTHHLACKLPNHPNDRFGFILIKRFGSSVGLVQSIGFSAVFALNTMNACLTLFDYGCVAIAVLS